MKSSRLGIILTFSLLASSVSAQTPDPTPAGLNTFQTDQQALCTAQPMTVERSYSFRILPRVQQNAGWYVPKKWWQKWFPFLDRSKEEVRFQKDDIRYMEQELGRPIPRDTSTRTDKINYDIDEFLRTEQTLAETAWSKWVEANPDGTKSDYHRAENEIRLKGLLAAKRKNFDWRENGLDLGPADFQGWDCSSCWAFASVDAIQIARRLALKRGILKELDEDMQPSARQMISCMVPKINYCTGNWHGKAFTFMIDNGLPLGGSDRYSFESSAYNCDAEMSVKPLTWGYISDAPSKISSPAEIKEAVVRFGAVVTMMTTDRCMWMYGSGVFNEQHYGDGTHILLIVGWDDTKGKEGAWLVKNSYGADWGENGFGWFEYGANSIGQFSAVVVADPNEKVVPASFKPVAQ